MRRAATILLALGLLVAGCGGDDESTTPGTTTGDSGPSTGSVPETGTTADPAAEAAVKRTIEQYKRSVGKDPKAFCAVFTKDQREFYSNSGSTGSCEKQAKDTFKLIPEEQFRAIASAPVETVKVSGDTATAELNVHAEPGEKVPISGLIPVALERSGGKWLISRQIGAR